MLPELSDGGNIDGCCGIFVGTVTGEDDEQDETCCSQSRVQ